MWLPMVNIERSVITMGDHQGRPYAGFLDLAVMDETYVDGGDFTLELDDAIAFGRVEGVGVAFDGMDQVAIDTNYDTGVALDTITPDDEDIAGLDKRRIGLSLL